MTQPAIIDGTPDELADYLAQHRDRKFRFIEIVEPEASCGAIVASGSILDDKAKSALALLSEWIAEGEGADPATRREADSEYEEFKRNMNANRAATGEEPLYS